MKKPLLKLLCPLLLAVLTSTVQASEGDIPVVKLNVVNLKFFYQKDPGKKQKLSELGELNLSANLAQNKIREFKADALLAQGTPLQDLTVSVDELKRSPKSFKVQGVSLGQLKSLGFNADGEGTLRFIPAPSLMGPHLPSYIDLNIRKVGLSQQWVVFYQGRVLQGFNLEVNKDPLQMSALSLVFSPPKIIGMNPDLMDCDASSIASSLMVYQAPELLRTAGCDLRKMDLKSIRDILTSLLWVNDQQNVYRSFYSGGSASAPELRLQSALTSLKDYGFDLNSLRAADLPANLNMDQDFFSPLINAGQKGIISQLAEAGLRPLTAANYNAGLLNTLQVDLKTRQVLKSNQGEQIFNIISSSKGSLPPAADVLMDLLDYEGNSTLTLASENFDLTREARQKMWFDFTSQIIDRMISVGLDMKSPATEFSSQYLTDIVRAHMKDEKDPDSYTNYFSQSQGEQLLQRLKAAGAR